MLLKDLYVGKKTLGAPGAILASNFYAGSACNHNVMHTMPCSYSIVLQLAFKSNSISWMKYSSVLRIIQNACSQI